MECDSAVRMVGHAGGYPQVERLSDLARVSWWWWAFGGCDAAVAKNCAHRQSRGRVVFPGGYCGMSGCVSGDWCNVGG